MADERLFQVEVITPERIFYTGEATMIEFTAEDGDIGVYKNHIPLTTVVAPGVLTISEAAGPKQAALLSGFAEILPDKVTILAEAAEWPGEIDIERAQKAKERAEQRLHAPEPSHDSWRSEMALKRALVRMNLGK
jgi:F-type H+-transporting ATPase subunit epsilon